MPLTERERAQLLGCSTRQARRLHKEVMAEIGTGAERLETFRRLLATHLPATKRVTLLKRLAEQREHLPTALKALEQANRIDGLYQPEEEKPQDYQPLFIYNVRVDVNGDGPEPQLSGPEQPRASLPPQEQEGE